MSMSPVGFYERGEFAIHRKEYKKKGSESLVGLHTYYIVAN